MKKSSIAFLIVLGIALGVILTLQFHYYKERHCDKLCVAGTLSHVYAIEANGLVNTVDITKVEDRAYLFTQTDSISCGTAQDGQIGCTVMFVNQKK